MECGRAWLIASFFVLTLREATVHGAAIFDNSIRGFDNGTSTNHDQPHANHRPHSSAGDSLIPRLLVPPALKENSSSSLNFKKGNRSNKLVLYKPIPVPLVYKSTFTSGPVSEETFRKIESTTSGDLKPLKKKEDEVSRNKISSSESEDHESSFRRRTISISDFSSKTPPLGHKQDGSSNLEAASIRGFIATPGRLVQRISGTPMQILEKMLIQGNRLQKAKNTNFSPSVSPSMTIIPAVVKSFPLQNLKKERRHLKTQLTSNSLGFTSFVQNDDGNSIRRNQNINRVSSNHLNRFAHRSPTTLWPTQLQSFRQPRFSSRVQFQPKKIIILSRIPSEDQPNSFWEKIFRIAPHLPGVSQASHPFNGGFVNQNAISRSETTSQTLVPFPRSPRRVHHFLKSTSSSPSKRKSQANIGIFQPLSRGTHAREKGSLSRTEREASTENELLSNRPIKSKLIMKGGTLLKEVSENVYVL